ncbi:hypothetical protein LSH36_174g09051, partial [Paralvinella palmiformis]
HILFITLLWATRLTGEHTGAVSNRKFIFSGNRYREAKSPGDNIGFRKCRSLVDTCHSSCQNEAEKLRTVWALSTSCRQLTGEKEPHRLTWATSGRHFLTKRATNQVNPTAFSPGLLLSDIAPLLGKSHSRSGHSVSVVRVHINTDRPEQDLRAERFCTTRKQSDLDTN